MADVKLQPEAEELLEEHKSAEGGKATAHYQMTDVNDWGQLQTLWDISLEKFGSIHIVCNGAGIYEPPSSDFWNPPGISQLAEDKADANPGVFKTFAVNTMAPIRLAQLAMDYWLEHREVEGNLLFVASLGAYVHSIQTPLYFASKAAIVSFVKSMSRLRSALGIRIAAICPGAVDTPIFYPDYCRKRVRPDDLTLTAEECAGIIMDVLTKSKYGDGNIVQVMRVGTKEEPDISVREVPLERLYPTGGPVGPENHLLEEEEKFIEQLKDKGMRHQDQRVQIDLQ
ncbi:hypothetical protein FSARC_21 [Fusarium sarcochroum]|uniref:Uncharacterized protein n=1 Tax=Fusarium sarcochroum TaxID=1208366 RepID=A0A8H4UCA6_9HYPO|nr:hypothetical protein FSARC_21 [Fusarium sarcochroum]